MIDSDNTVTVSLNLDQFSSNMYPASTNWVSSTDSFTVEDIVVPIDTGDEVGSGGDPLQFSGDVDPSTSSGVSISEGSLSVENVMVPVDHPHTGGSDSYLNGFSANMLPVASSPSVDVLSPVDSPNVSGITGSNICEKTGHSPPVVTAEPEPDLIVSVDTPHSSTRGDLDKSTAHMSPATSICIESEDRLVSVDTPCSRSSLGDSGQLSGSKSPSSSQHHSGRSS